MKPHLAHRQKILAFLLPVTGFSVSFLIVLLLKAGTPRPAGNGQADAPPVRKPEEGTQRLKSVRSDIAALYASKSPASPSGVLALASSAGALSDAEMESLLDSIGTEEKPWVPARLILLLRWADRNPDAVMSWLLKSASTRHPLPSNRLDEVIRVCAAKNTAGLMAWTQNCLKEVTAAQGFGHRIVAALATVDPVAAAILSAQCSITDIWDTGANMFTFMQSVDDVRPLLAVAMEKLAPLDTPKIEGQRVFGADEKQFQGWEFLYQAALVRWHEHAPETLETWLRTQPGTFQTDARSLIAAREKASFAFAPFPETPQASTPETFDREDFTAVPSPESVPAARKDWSAWWKKDPAAAETFLRQSAWPVDLKFRARAAAYATSP